MTDETAANGHDEEGLEAEAADDEALALKAEVAALKEQILRIAADAENTKRRAERDANDARAYAIQKFARDLLGAADNLALATAHAPKDVADQLVKNFVVGVEMTQKELLGAFERNGLTKVEPGKGDKFDPHLHQAMMEQPGEDVPPGSVIRTLQAGYQLMGRIVRPAMVIVAAKGAGAAPAGEAPAQNPYAATEADEAGGAVDQKA